MSGLQLTDISLVLRDITPPEDVAPAPIPIPNGEGPAHTHDSEVAHATLDMSSAGETVPSAPSTLAVPAETLASFTLAERTLEEFDVSDFVHRLSTSIPSLQHIMVAIGRPTRTRCGGLFRSVCLGKTYDKDSEEAHMRVYTGGKILYKERKEPELQRTRAKSQNAFNRRATWASVSRASYQGFRSGLGEGGRVVAAGGAAVV